MRRLMVVLPAVAMVAALGSAASALPISVVASPVSCGGNCTLTGLTNIPTGIPPGSLSTTTGIIYNFEFNGSIGPSTSSATGGIGLIGTYTAYLTTGLKVFYTGGVQSTGLLATIADLDAKADANGHPDLLSVLDDEDNKIEPALVFLDASGNQLAGGAVGPTVLVNYLFAATSVDGKEDTWSLHVGDLASSLGFGSIGGYVLYADASNVGKAKGDEAVPSDPYFLVDETQGTTVPEPASLLLLGTGLAFFALGHLRSRQSDTRRVQGGPSGLPGEIHPAQQRLEPRIVANAVVERHRRQMRGDRVSGVDRLVQPFEHAVVAEPEVREREGKGRHGGRPRDLLQLGEQRLRFSPPEE